MLDFTCSTCGKHVQADDSFAGKRVVCPACEAAINATIAHPTAASTGPFSEGLPPVRDGPIPITFDDGWPRVSRWLAYSITAVIVTILLALIIPAWQKGREADARARSINNFKQIVLAAHNFADANKCLPFNGTKPAAPGDATSGSWAFMILPYFGNSLIYTEKNTDVGQSVYMCPGRGRPDRCTGAGGPGAWTDYFINPFVNDPNGVPDAPNNKMTLVAIGDGSSNTIFAGHGQIRPRDYSSTDAIPGFTTTIFNGGNPAMCRGNKKVVHMRDSGESLPGNWGGPFRDGSLMGMCDGTVRMFPYTINGGDISNGNCTPYNSFGSFLTPNGNEVILRECY
jgi:Protein of unknown function (DUF1559)